MNSWQQQEIAIATLAKEVGYIRKPHTDRLRVALAFPNTYYVGMSNLGFQTVYQLFNAHEDVVCERIFLPPKQQLKEQLASKTPLITLESQSLARDFDVIAFSVSFEWDYTNILTMLRLAGVPVRASEPNVPRSARRDRRGRHLCQSRAAGAVCRCHRGGRRRRACAGAARQLSRRRGPTRS